MNKLATIIGITLLVAALAIPVFAWGPNWGRGHHMMGYGGNGAEYGRDDYGNLTSDQKSKLDEKTLNYQLEARKIVPDQRLGYGYGGGYDRHMGPYGRGMGYGAGYCWN